MVYRTVEGTALEVPGIGGAENRAAKDADVLLDAVMETAVGVVYCPACCLCQAKMVQEARDRGYGWANQLWGLLLIASLLFVCISAVAWVKNGLSWKLWATAGALMATAIIVAKTRSAAASKFNPNCDVPIEQRKAQGQLRMFSTAEYDAAVARLAANHE